MEDHGGFRNWDASVDRLTFKLPKETIQTEARKLIRTEKLGALEKRKDDRILEREIEKFKTRLQLDRTLHAFEEQIAPKTPKTTRLKRSQETPISALQKTHKVKPLQIEMRKKTSLSSENFTRVPEGEIQQRSIPATPSIPEELSPPGPKPRNEGSIQKSQKLPPTEGRMKISSVESKSPMNREKKAPKQIEAILMQFHARQSLLYYWQKWALYVVSRKNKRLEEQMWRDKIFTFMQRFNDRPKVVKKPQAEEESPQVFNEKIRRPQVNQARKRTSLKPTKQPSKPLMPQPEKTKLAPEIRRQLDPTLKGKEKIIRQFNVTHEKKGTSPPPRLKFHSPEILMDMDQKHKERKERLAIIQEQKRKLEEEKDRRAKEKYEQQLYEAEMEKKRKITEFRRKLRLERLQREKKRAEWERTKELEERAIQFYNRKLMSKYGFIPWRTLTLKRRVMLDEANEHNMKRIFKWAFLNWRQVLLEIEKEKMKRASEFHSLHLLKLSFQNWRDVMTRRHVQTQVAEDWYDYVLSRNTLISWLHLVIEEQAERRRKWMIAVAHYRRKIMVRCIKHWMLLPQTIRLERAKELRLSQWREKVQQVLPDYRPPMHSSIIELV